MLSPNSLERRLQLSGILLILGPGMGRRPGDDSSIPNGRCSGWSLDTSEKRYKRIPSPRRSPPTARKRTNAMERATAAITQVRQIPYGRSGMLA
jgi:hypothetical protein